MDRDLMGSGSDVYVLILVFVLDLLRAPDTRTRLHDPARDSQICCDQTPLTNAETLAVSEVQRGVKRGVKGISLF